MKKYNPDAKCIKCGGSEILDRHADASTPSEMAKSIAKFTETKEPQDKPERIIRKCKNCEFIWIEVPLDNRKDEYIKEAIEKSAINRDNLMGTADEVMDALGATLASAGLDEDEIKVGDSVYGDCDDTVCKVIGIEPRNNRCAIQSIEYPWCVCDTISQNDRKEMLCIKHLTPVKEDTP